MGVWHVVVLGMLALFGGAAAAGVAGGGGGGGGAPGCVAGTGLEEIGDLRDWDLRDWDLRDWDLRDWDLRDWDLRDGDGMGSLLGLAGCGEIWRDLAGFGLSLGGCAVCLALSGGL
jgi:hypothetical protein